MVYLLGRVWFVWQFCMFLVGYVCVCVHARLGCSVCALILGFTVCCVFVRRNLRNYMVFALTFYNVVLIPFLTYVILL